MRGEEEARRGSDRGYLSAMENVEGLQVNGKLICRVMDDAVTREAAGVRVEG